MIFFMADTDISNIHLKVNRGKTANVPHFCRRSKRVTIALKDTNDADLHVRRQ